MSSQQCSTCPVISEQCPNCRISLPAEAGFIFCSKCKVPQFLGDLRSPFEILGVPRSFNLDEKALEARYYTLSKMIHPDRYSAAGGEAKVKSQELSAALNQSYRALRNPEPRLDTLLKSIGALEASASAQTSAKDQLPAELAEEFFDLQEKVMDAAMEDEAQAISLADQFAAKLGARHEQLTSEMFSLASRLDWLKPDRNLVDKTIKLRQERSFVRSMIENLETLKKKVAS